MKYKLSTPSCIIPVQKKKKKVKIEREEEEGREGKTKADLNHRQEEEDGSVDYMEISGSLVPKFTFFNKILDHQSPQANLLV